MGGIIKSQIFHDRRHAFLCFDQQRSRLLEGDLLTVPCDRVAGKFFNDPIQIISAVIQFICKFLPGIFPRILLNQTFDMLKQLFFHGRRQCNMQKLMKILVLQFSEQSLDQPVENIQISGLLLEQLFCHLFKKLIRIIQTIFIFLCRNMKIILFVNCPFFQTRR